MKLSMLNRTLILAVALLCSPFVQADDKSDALAKEYLELSKTKESLEHTVNTTVEQMVANGLGENKSELKAFFNSYMGWEVMEKPSIRVVSSILTPSELKAINAFYKTPEGQSYAKKTPALSAAMSQEMVKNLQKAMLELQKK